MLTRVLAVLVAAAAAAFLALAPAYVERGLNPLHAPDGGWPVSPKAKALHDRLADIFKTLFVEPNPVPVKHCMMRAGLLRSAEVRLPLCEMSEANRLLVEKVADATLASLR